MRKTKQKETAGDFTSNGFRLTVHTGTESNFCRCYIPSGYNPPKAEDTMRSFFVDSPFLPLGRCGSGRLKTPAADLINSVKIVLFSLS